MNVLPKIFNIKSSRFAGLKESYTLLCLNNSNEVALSYIETPKYNYDILSDLLECKAYATALLYLNESCILSDNYGYILKENKVEDYYSDCNDLLNENIEVVEEAGIPLVDINGYKIFEGAGYILRGNGKKKIKESFSEDSDEVEEKEDINEDGTKTTDIAPKVDQDMNKKVTTSKKKHYDILLSGLDEGLEILNKGFLKNSKGQYQRGNYILVKEGEKYLAIHKDKLKEGKEKN